MFYFWFFYSHFSLASLSSPGRRRGDSGETLGTSVYDAHNFLLWHSFSLSVRGRCLMTYLNFKGLLCFHGGGVVCLIFLISVIILLQEPLSISVSSPGPQEGDRSRSSSPTFPRRSTGIAIPSPSPERRMPAHSTAQQSAVSTSLPCQQQATQIPSMNQPAFVFPKLL